MIYIFAFFIISQHWDGHVIETLCHGEILHNPLIPHNQYHSCWWPGDARSQGISSNGVIYFVWPKISIHLQLKPEYSKTTGSIPWQLMPWLFVPSGDHQPWYWICRVKKSFPSIWKSFNYQYHVSAEKWRKMQIYFEVYWNKFSTRRTNVVWVGNTTWECAYHKTSNISRTLAGNKIVDHSDVVGALPVGTAPTTSSFLT